jgi:nucleoside-triphosphatase THEP1
LIIYCILGLISALIGIRIGRKLLKQPSVSKPLSFTNSFTGKQSETKSEFRYSIIWLVADIVLIIGSLILLNYTTWIFWSTGIIFIVTIWAFRYKRALRQLSRPKFWIIFVLITMVTAFVFTKVLSGSNGLEQGLLLGLQMNFRAVMIIVGFSVLGTELYNPRIRNFFLKTYFKQLPLALELSFESLPSMISNIPDLKTILNNPVSVFYQVISQVDSRLAEIKSKIDPDRRIFILTGSSQQGKTTQIQKIISVLKENKIEVGGIFSPRIMENNKTTGYDIVDIITNQREIFLRLTEDESLMKIGRFSIIPQGLQKGLEILKSSATGDNNIVIIDEAGHLELENRGWAGSIQDLLDNSDKHILLVVRDTFVDKIIQKWDLRNVIITDISDKDHLQISKMIIEQII